MVRRRWISGTILAGLVGAAAGGAWAPAGGQELALRGRVTFEGSPPPARAIDMSADPYCAGAHADPLVQREIDVSGGGLADAVVWLEGGPPAAAGPPAPATLDQVGCVYLPRALTVRTGQSLIIRNSDSTLHNVNVQPATNPAFNVGQPFAGLEVERVFDSAEIGIPVRCDIHPWMSGSISVFDHDRFAVTGADGSFTIPGLAAGELTVGVWHPNLGSLTRRIVLDPESDPIELRYSE